MMMMMDMIAGYVQQEDLFLATLTVQEHLIFQVYNIIYRQATHTTVLELYTRVNVDCVHCAGQGEDGQGDTHRGEDPHRTHSAHQGIRVHHSYTFHPI